MRVGFIGLGDMGLLQSRSFSQVAHCTVAAGADLSPEMRQRFAENHPDAQRYATPTALLEQSNVDGVVIAVPTGYHQQVASLALAAGIPVLLEKPMARTVAQCLQLIEQAEATNTLLMVGQCRRYDPYWLAWAERVKSGELGMPILWRDARARFNARSWFMDHELGGGPLLDGAIHNYDFANMLFGEPESAYTSALKLNPAVSAVDTGSTIIRYRNGSQLLISWSWAARGLVLHDIIGPEGFIQFGTGSTTPPTSDNGHYLYCTLTNRAGEESLIRVQGRSHDMYVRQAEHFLACIRGEVDCRTPGTEAIKAVAVAEAVLRSAHEGTVQAIAWEAA